MFQLRNFAIILYIHQKIGQTKPESWEDNIEAVYSQCFTRLEIDWQKVFFCRNDPVGDILMKLERKLCGQCHFVRLETQCTIEGVNAEDGVKLKFLNCLL